MASASASLHEDEGKLNPKTIDQHRAFVSLQEELEAADWYNQRVEAATDPELAAILAHNRDEEKEHAAMVLEWLRRRDPNLDLQLRNYLFVDKPVLEREMELDEAQDETPQCADGSLGIGSLRAAPKP